MEESSNSTGDQKAKTALRSPFSTNSVFSKLLNGVRMLIRRRYFCVRLPRLFSWPKSVFWIIFLVVLAGTTILSLRNHAIMSKLYLTKRARRIDTDEIVPPACKLPILDPWHKSVFEYLKELKPLKCEGRLHSRLQDGKLMLPEEVSDVVVEEISRVTGDDLQIKFKKLNTSVMEENPEKHTRSLGEYEGTTKRPINSEFIRVKGKLNGLDFEEFHLQFVPNPNVLKRPIKSEGLGLNVFMIMLDSTSAANFLRNMRNTMNYLRNNVDTIFFQGEGIVGDGTTAQLSAMLTGIAEEDQVESRRGKPGAKSIDDWRWIYKDFKDNGYATLLSEDQAFLGTFNLRLVGFEEAPTDHYARPFWISVHQKKRMSGGGDYCLESQAIHNFTLEYVKSFTNAYPQRPKFSLAIFSYLTHAKLNTLRYIDDDLVQFLDDLKSTKTLDNSMVIIFGDHGFRIGGYRKTTQGKLEERLPFLSITLPTWFSKKHKQFYNNLKYNSKILTSPFDVYATLRHVLSYPKQPGDIVTGQSLFNRIDRKNRTCQDAGIDVHWCPCMQWEKVDSDHQIIKTISHFLLDYINNMTSSTDFLRQSCQPFTLQKIQEAWKEAPNIKVQTFQNTVKIDKCDSCVAVFGRKSNDTLARDTQYQIQVVAEPGPAVFEASVRMMNGHAQLNNNFISRINKYGDQPHCVRDTHTHLMKYCYCRHQRTQ